SQINEKILKHLKNKRLTNLALISRSASRLAEFASLYSVKALNWSHLLSWHSYDWIIFGSKTSDPLVSTLPEKVSHKLVMDLSVPRNVDPALAPFLTLHNIDHLNTLLNTRKAHLTETLTSADRLIADLSQQHLSQFLSKQSSKLKVLAMSA